MVQSTRKTRANIKPVYVVKGTVQSASSAPLVGMSVTAFDQHITHEDLLGEAITDQEGNYSIAYSESQFRRTGKEVGGPDLIVRVYSAEGKVMTQSKRKRNAGREETVNLTVGSEGPFVVSGAVRHSDGRPATGALIRAYDQDLRKKQVLGKATSDAAGHYSISYTSRKFLRAEKTSADLCVVVVNAKGKELASSEVLFNAPSEATIDLTLPPDGQTLSEFELLLEDILPLLAGQGNGGANLKIAELEEKDIAFLSRESGQPKERITFLLAAANAALATPPSSGVKVKSYVSKSQGPAIPVEAFYGWFRQGLPADLDKLLNQSEDMLRRALDASLRANIIPAALGDALDYILARLQQLAAERLLKPGEPYGKASLDDLLSTVLPDSQMQRALASLFGSHQGTGEAYWEALRGTPGFGKAKIGQIQTTLQLGMLTGNHLPLVRELQRLGQEDPELKELRGFTKLDVADWENILRRPQENGQPIGFPADVQGQDESARITNYAGKLNHYIESTFPTAVIAHRLEKDNQVDSPFMQTKADLKTFFANNPAFEFETTPVDLYLSQDRDKRLKGVKQAEELTVQLKNIQRVFKITPYFEQINALLADNLHSSQAIVHMGKREFVEKHAGTFGGEEPAMIAYTLAEHIHKQLSR